MKFSPAFIKLNKELPLLDTEERKERIKNLAVGKDPSHFSSIIEESPDSLVSLMAYYFKKSLHKLLEEEDVQMLKITRGRIYLALANGHAREFHDIREEERTEKNTYQTLFLDYINKALSFF